ncbi:M20/M25/M40 family metallo-hydrolase [Christensenellaceae bacterium OttesenSCG-928-L17]|nr:M20/M25/M40 family metallo-hydrolase [Christensenellaceae bacterium OttesenSCG-928-L17]
MLWWIIPLTLLVAFLVFISVRALLFKPKPHTRADVQDASFDEEGAIDALVRTVQCKTVSYRDTALEDPQEFEKFQALLPVLFPKVHETCTLEHIGKRGLLYHWKGKSAEHPTVYMSHYDVVPADEHAWQRPAFEGLRENGEIWGRGTLDTKGTLCAALTAAETMIAASFVPENDVYFSFAADEEIAGYDAPSIVDTLKARNIQPALVLDEGGAVVESVFPGVSAPCALIGTGEKGLLNLEFSAQSTGGHASAPPPHTVVGQLARAVSRMESSPFPAHISPPAAEMFDTLGRHSTFVYRVIFANLWCFKGILSAMCKKSGGELNALLRTTCAFTMMEGGSALNVLPANGKVCANLRLMNPDTMESAVEYLKKVINDKDVAVRIIDGNNPSPYSPTSSAGYARVSSAIEQTWPDALVSPYLMVACSDSRHFSRVSENVLRFSAMALSSDDRKRIHAHDERVGEEQFLDAVRFYIRMMQQS